MARNSLSVFLFLLASSNAVFSQPEIKAVFTKTAPVIDGCLNDEAWKNASVVGDLYQREPNQGKPASEKSEFMFLFDQDNIYVGIYCHDDPKGITAKELARDVSLGDDDRIQVILDTYLDGRSGYWFQIGPRGSIGDALVNENGKDFNKSWDGLWDGKARIIEDGWTAEMIIPYKTLSFKKGNTSWGLKIIRYIKRKSETSTWPATSLNGNRFQLSDAGRITSITGITQGIGLDMIPFLTAGSSKKEGEKSDPVLDGGLDMFYNITPSLKAALTINTDFAQTEVDDKQINLTRFSLFFPEKRDFFLDGANYFTFGINGDSENPMNTQNIPFFSRRIGLDADGNPVPIIYGGKFTGKIGNWNLGLIHVKDDNKWDNPGYTAGRISRNFWKQSSLGIIGTNGDAFSSVSSSLAGIDLRLANSEIAGNKNITYNLYTLKSFTDSLKGNDLSVGTEINYPNDFLNFRIGYMQIGQNYNAGLGFVPRKDIRNFYGGIGLGPRPRNSPLMQIKSGIKYGIYSRLKEGGIETAEIDFNIFDLIFLSGDDISFTSSYQFESLEEDFNIIQDYVIPAGDYYYWRHTLSLTSAKRRNLWVSLRGSFGSFYSGNRKDLDIQAGYKISVPVYIGAESSRTWVDLPGGSFVTQIFRLNLNFLFSPNLSWYNYAQYENQTKLAGLQSRFQWIIKPGKEIYLTFNSPFIDPLDRFHTEAYEARLKVNYAIRF
jgi:hypothetical protein